mgnify:FL=1
MRDNKYLVSYCPIAGSTRRSGRFFPHTREGFMKAIKLASREGVSVTFDGMIVWDGAYGARRGEAVRNRAILALEGRIEAG